MLAGLGWMLQVLALVVVALALLVGFAYDQIRTEVAMMAVGGGMFLLGRWLQQRDG
jgi:hypothetical protein